MRTIRHSTTLLPALAVGVLAIVLPAGTLADAMAATPERAGVLTTGFTWLRGALLLLALMLACTPWLVSVSADHRGSPRRLTSADALPLGIALTLALALRLYHLNTGLWLDEVLTLADYVKPPLRELLTTYASQNNHPLYSLAAHLSWNASGHQEWSIRLPAVLFGVASLWASFRLARAVSPRHEAWLVTGLLVVSYHHVWFSQNARGYTALLFFTVIGTHLLYDLVTGRSVHPRRDAWAYGLAMGLGTYVHLTGALVVVGHVLMLLLPIRSGSTRVGWTARRAGLSAAVFAAVVSLVLYAVILSQLIFTVLEPTMGETRVEWKSMGWLLSETLRGLSTGLPGGLLIPVAAVAVMVAGLWSWWKQDALLAGFLVAPVLITLAGAVALGHNLWPRFFFFAASFLVMLAIRGGLVLSRVLFKGHGDRVGTIGGAAVIALSLLILPGAWRPKQDYAGVARTVAAMRRPDDAIVAIDIAAVIDSLGTGIPGAARVYDLASLEAIERVHPRTIAIYTFPVRVRAVAPGLLDRLESSAYDRITVIPATVGGGAFHIVAHPRP